MGTLVTTEITLPAGGTYVHTWNSPRTNRQTFAKSVSVKPTGVSAITVSTDGGANNMSVGPSGSELRFQMRGIVPSLYITGPAGTKVEIAAEIAA